MARWIWLALAAQLVGGHASAQELHQLPSTGLAWRMKPNGNDIAEVYPSKAQRDETAGWGVVECLTTETGDMKDCKILGEAPTNSGFGAAALKLAPKFKLDARKMDPTVLTNGVITIPIILVTPTGAPVPLRDHLVGDPSALLTPSGGQGIPCPTQAAPTQKCVTHQFTWARRPTIVETAALVRSVTTGAPMTGLICSIREDMQLSDCAELGPTDATQTAAMNELVKLFAAPVEADDKTPTRRGWIMIQFNWSALQRAVETSALTNPRP